MQRGYRDFSGEARFNAKKSFFSKELEAEYNEKFSRPSLRNPFLAFGKYSFRNLTLCHPAIFSLLGKHLFRDLR